MVKKLIYWYKFSKLNPKPQFLFPYNKAKNIGLLINADDDKKPKETNAIIEEMKKEKKRLTILVYASTGTNINYYFDHILVQKKDFNWYGKIANKKVQHFLGKSYDLLYVFSEKFCFEIDAIVLMCKSKCKLGIIQDKPKDFLDLMVKSSKQSQDSLFSQLYCYSKKIK
jgi:hypothetical protein